MPDESGKCPQRVCGKLFAYMSCVCRRNASASAFVKSYRTQIANMHTHNMHTRHKSTSHTSFSFGLQLETDEEELELIAGSSLEHYHWVDNISQALKSTQKPTVQHQQCKNTFQGPVYAVGVYCTYVHSMCALCASCMCCIVVPSIQLHTVTVTCSPSLLSFCHCIVL